MPAQVGGIPVGAPAQAFATTVENLLGGHVPGEQMVEVGAKLFKQGGKGGAAETFVIAGKNNWQTGIAGFGTVHPRDASALIRLKSGPGTHALEGLERLIGPDGYGDIRVTGFFHQGKAGTATAKAGAFFEVPNQGSIRSATDHVAF